MMEKMKNVFRLAVALLLPAAAQAAGTGDFENAKDKTLIVQCDDSTGSGFVCEMEGRRYFVTNKHVIRGQKRVAAFFCDGRTLKLGRMEIARDADLVRFAVSSNQPAFKVSDVEPRMHEKVRVFGNSDGKGVITYIQGRIIGIGPDEL
jgi:S1-C subfamily serine protease